MFHLNTTHNFQYKIQYYYAKLYDTVFSKELLSCSPSPRCHLCDCQGMAFWARDGGRAAPLTTGSSSSQGGISPLFPFPHLACAFTRESQNPAGLRGMEKKAFQCHSSVSRARLVALFSNHCAALGVRTSRMSHCGKIA